jgi:hypothetical protein
MATSVMMGVMARGTVAVTVGASDAAAPPLPSMGSLPPQPTARTLNISIMNRARSPNWLSILFILNILCGFFMVTQIVKIYFFWEVNLDYLKFGNTLTMAVTTC